MNKIKFLSIVLATVFLLTACDARTIRGSGNVIKETRQASDFDSIVLTGAGKVIVTQDGSESLRIETDDNILPHLQPFVKNGALVLGDNDNSFGLLLPTQLIYYVSVDDLTGLTLTGSGDIEATQINTDQLAVTISGSGNIRISDLSTPEVTTEITGSGEATLEGQVNAQEISMIGSGKYLTGDLCSTTVKVKVVGSGNVTVCATGTLNSTITGSGSVNYYGSPSIHASGSGSGNLNSLGDH